MGKFEAAPRAADVSCLRPIRPEDMPRPMSRNEQLVYDELLTASVPLKAYALLERLHDQGLRAPMTIYRALDSLIARGLVRKVASLNAFLAPATKARKGISAIVICSTCGRTRTIAIQNKVAADLLAPAGMAISKIFIEAFAECASDDCAAPSEDAAHAS